MEFARVKTKFVSMALNYLFAIAVYKILRMDDRISVNRVKVDLVNMIGRKNLFNLNFAISAMGENMSLELNKGNCDTLLHIQTVNKYLNQVIRKLLDRGEAHDQSKLYAPESELFNEYNDNLKTTKYPSEEYNKNVEENLKPALDHHYAKNRHHPEHFKNGINDMNLIDLIEMFCDWKASTLRQHDGNLNKSIEHNANRFHMDAQLTKIFENTAKEFDG